MKQLFLFLFATLYLQVIAQTSAPNSPGPFLRNSFQMKFKGDPVKAIQKYCFNSNGEPFFSDEMLFKEFGRSLTTNDNVQELASDLSFRYDMEKTKVSLLSFIHQYDLGKISGKNAQECMISVDGLTNLVTQGNYAQAWASFYKYLDEEAKRAQAQSEKKQKDEAYKNSPDGQLEDLYYDYAFIKKCFDIRKGYSIVYINEIEIENGRKAVKTKQDDLLKRHPGLQVKKDAIWTRAASKVDSSDYVKLVTLGRFDNDYKFFCQASYQRLNSEIATKKDF
jgi:hypothetical protein